MNEAQYKNMVEAKKRRSRELVAYAIKTIKERVTKGEPVSVAILVDKTNLSRTFFYNNKEVHDVLEAAMKKQKGQDFDAPKREILDKALHTNNQKLERENQRLKDANEELKEEIERLREVIEHYNLAEYEKINPYE